MKEELFQNFKERVIVVAEALDRRVLLALRHAKTMSEDVLVFGTFADEEEEPTLRQRWERMAPGVPLLLRHTPEGGVAEPLVQYLHAELDAQPEGPSLTVLLPRLIGAHSWGRLLGVDNSKYVERRLLALPDVHVEVYPIRLQGDREALRPDMPKHK